MGKINNHHLRGEIVALEEDVKKLRKAVEDDSVQKFEEVLGAINLDVRVMRRLLSGTYGQDAGG